MTATLSQKRLRFCQEYVIDCNASQAYIRAGYTAKNADANATRLMGNDGIRAEIERLTKEIAAKAKLSALEAWRELRCLAMSNIADIYDCTGQSFRLKPAN